MKGDHLGGFFNSPVHIRSYSLGYLRIGVVKKREYSGEIILEILLRLVHTLFKTFIAIEINIVMRYKVVIIP